MCGIIGAIVKETVTPRLLEGLLRLEYRGYDSAGIGTLVSGRIECRRAEGKLTNLAERLKREPVRGTIGIGHTRWATHGLPTESNAHPIATNRVAVVHNGIIENFQALTGRSDRTWLWLSDRHRYRGSRDPRDPFPRSGADAAAGGGANFGAARRGVCARLFVRRRTRFVDRCPARQPARDRLWRWRDVFGLRCAGPGAADPPHHLSRGG